MDLLKLAQNVFILIMTLALAACGGGSGGSGSSVAPIDSGGNQGPATPSTDLSVSFFKGAVAGATCRLFEIDEAGVVSTSALATDTTDASGVAELVNVPYEGVALVACGGGLYSDEATGAELEPSEMRAVIDTTVNAAPVVTPMTEIAVQRAESDSSGILSTLTLYNSDNDLGIDVTAVVPTDLNTEEAGDDDEGNYAILLAIISQLAENADADTPEELAGLIEDIVEGVITDADFAVAAEDLSNAASPAVGNIPSALLDSVVADLGLPINESGVVSILGNYQEGETLIASLVDENGTLNAMPGYQWVAAGSDISSANSSSYVLTADEVGLSVSVIVSYTDDDGFSEEIIGTGTELVAAANSGGDGDGDGWGSADSVPVISCDSVVSSLSALEDATEDPLDAGTTICLADGTYTGRFELDYGGMGTRENPIKVAAENPGSAIISGESSVQMYGEYVVLQGLIFQGGETRNSDLIQTRTSSTEFCNYCRITEISIVDIDYGNFEDSGKWMNLYGHHNRIDHNWFAGKAERSVMLSINREAPDSGATDTEIDYFQVDHNYFGDRAPTDGKAYADSSDNDYEAIRTGVSESHAYDSFSVIENNYFERIDGEAEVISNKAGNNIIRNNTVRDSFGSITTRHGSSATIANNFMLGDGHPFAGGLRIIDDGHRIVNNYIEGARYLATNFHGGIVIHNSDGSTSNGYQDVENILVAHNTVVNSVNSLNFRGGNEDDSPDSIYFVNNLFADVVGPLIRNGDESLPTNSTYAGNYYDASEFSDDDGFIMATGFTARDPQLEEDGIGVLRPDASSSVDLSAALVSIGAFDAIEDDMDGQTRSNATVSGADEDVTGEIFYGVLTPSDVGPLSYMPPESQGYVIRVPVVNFDFEDDGSGWVVAAPAALATGAEDIFAGEKSVKISSASGRVEQTLSIEANTNYTLSAFTKGPTSLGAELDGISGSLDANNSSYRFSSYEFNSGSSDSVTIFAEFNDLVKNNVDIQVADFASGEFQSSASNDNPWVIVEGGSIGQVQSSSNSASGPNGSLRFRYNTVDETGSPMVSQVLTDIQPNTDYELSVWVRADPGITGTIGFYNGETTTVLTDKLLDFDALEQADAPKGDDSFRQDTLSFNSGNNSSLTLFIMYTANTIHVQNPEFESSGNIGNSDLRIDDIEMTFLGAPQDGLEAFVDEFRLVSHPGNSN